MLLTLLLVAGVGCGNSDPVLDEQVVKTEADPDLSFTSDFFRKMFRPL